MKRATQTKRALVAAFIWLQHGTNKDQRRAALAEVKVALAQHKIDPYNFRPAPERAKT